MKLTAGVEAGQRAQSSGGWTKGHRAAEAGQRDTEQRRPDKGTQSGGDRLTITKEKAEREYGET
ncbi:hypothetical protein [uncultured Clostridium sp.]|uniref:hypothetical protein n=1 Tax=uncultured Clostridium sp. TaxID=59620 RepID=UPI0025FA97EC|nr:hypothetical protein [uncultured Clostridium sp.]